MRQLDPKAVWLFFIGFFFQWFFLVAMVFFMIFGMAVESNAGGFARSLIDYFLNPFFDIFLFIIYLLAIFVWSKLSLKYYRYEITPDAFKKEHGVIWKKYVSIPYERIQNIDIYRGLLARILGLSDLHIQTAGGITQGSYGSFTEGRLPGLSREEAERLRDELIKLAKSSKGGQGL